MLALQHFRDNLWIANGPPVSALGPIKLPTRMIVVRLSSGSLWINSPIEPSADVIEHINAIGTVGYLVAPTPMHVWRLKSWRALFPHAQVWGPPNARRAPAAPGFVGLLGDAAPEAWTGDIEQVVFRGNLFFDEVEFLHQPSRTLMVTDFIQNYPAVEGDVVGNVAKTLGGVLDGGVPRDIRWSITDRVKARESVGKILSWDFDAVILAHGACVDHNAKPFVKAAFRWLGE